MSRCPCRHRTLPRPVSSCQKQPASLTTTLVNSFDPAASSTSASVTPLQSPLWNPPARGPGPGPPAGRTGVIRASAAGGQHGDTDSATQMPARDIAAVMLTGPTSTSPQAASRRPRTGRRSDCPRILHPPAQHARACRRGGRAAAPVVSRRARKATVALNDVVGDLAPRALGQVRSRSRVPVSNQENVTSIVVAVAHSADPAPIAPRCTGTPHRCRAGPRPRRRACPAPSCRRAARTGRRRSRSCARDRARPDGPAAPSRRRSARSRRRSPPL